MNVPTTIPQNRMPYPDPSDPSVWRLPLADGSEALIDAADAPAIGEFLWAWSPQNGVFRSVYTRRRTVTLHRFLAGEPRHRYVQPKNGDLRDCRRSNLVIISSNQHRQIREKTARLGGKPTSSKFKGVSYLKAKNRWDARIVCNGQPHYLGANHRSEDEAARAYDRMARKLFGPLAKLNFPETGELSAARSSDQHQAHEQERPPPPGDIPSGRPCRR